MEHQAATTWDLFRHVVTLVGFLEMNGGEGMLLVLDELFCNVNSHAINNPDFSRLTSIKAKYRTKSCRSTPTLGHHLFSQFVRCGDRKR